MGETTTEKLILWLIVLFLFVVLPAILQAIAKRKAQQAPGPREGEEEEPEQAREEERPARAARGTDIKRYLESIGVRVERKVEQAPPEEEPLPEAEPAPPPREQVRIRFGPFNFEVQRPGPPPPAQPVRRRIQVPVQRHAPAEPLPARPEPARSPAEAPRPTAAPVQRPVAPVILSAALASHPSLGELRRAVVLSEVLRRPDFSQLPCDREIL